MISVKGVSKKYGDKIIYDGFDLEIEEGKILVILGESGSGKTTLLNMIGGLTNFDGEITGDYSPLSFVFQKDALIPALTVEENISLVCKGVDTAEELESVGLKDYAKSYPKVLSGGMARRVALLRGLLFPAKTVLLDEPFINLDAALKVAFIDRIKNDCKKTGKTVVAVTHDAKEATLLADRIVVLKGGKIVADFKDDMPTETELFDFMVTLGDTPKELSNFKI